MFEECGFDIEILGPNQIYSSGKRWRRAYKKDGVDGLQNTRKKNLRSPSKKELSIEEKYTLLKVKNSLLKAENKLLKKIELLERGMIKK
ncbi:hypothetical protein JYG23_12025 [Sedimentibacter sp. zth1]|uniref:hypothetical protein n=1 Tax=Sedimentibacter sp. zth1 TaxID=2816908 RepID=UPI001A92CCFD|nr:hypothetical protein JYG23_12025 [Sedimentibacter sp. zth1]